MASMPAPAPVCRRWPTCVAKHIHDYARTSYVSLCMPRSMHLMRAAVAMRPLPPAPPPSPPYPLPASTRPSGRKKKSPPPPAPRPPRPPPNAPPPPSPQRVKKKRPPPPPPWACHPHRRRPPFPSPRQAPAISHHRHGLCRLVHRHRQSHPRQHRQHAPWCRPRAVRSQRRFSRTATTSNWEQLSIQCGWQHAHGGRHTSVSRVRPFGAPKWKRLCTIGDGPGGQARQACSSALHSFMMMVGIDCAAYAKRVKR